MARYSKPQLLLLLTLLTLSIALIDCGPQTDSSPKKTDSDKPPAATSSATPAPVASADVAKAGELLIAELIHNSFGAKLEIVPGNNPLLLRGDLNGDGLSDLLVVVKPPGKRSELAKDVKAIDIEASSNGKKAADKDADISAKGVAVAVIHGGAEGKQTTSPTKFLLYNLSWVGWQPGPDRQLTLLAKAQQQRDKAGYVKFNGEDSVRLPKEIKGDAVIFPTEAGINTTLYWDGNSYRFYLDPDEAP